MNKVKIMSFLIICLFFNIGIKAQKIKLPVLAKELKTMRDVDQKLRKKWVKLANKGKTKTKKFARLTNMSVAQDSINTERMKEIIAQHGWPTYDLVGKSSSVSAWLIVQHADRDPLFQMRCLPLLKDAAEHGQSDLVNYAYLYDRVQIAKGDKQLYATQSTTNNGIMEGHFQPIEDESNVQNRRSEMGFDLHVETYANKLGFAYKIPTSIEAKDRAALFNKSYHTNIEQARLALESKDYIKAADFYNEALKSNGSSKTADFVEAARAHALSKHKKSTFAPFLLIKAAIRGYENCDLFKKDKDFAYLKEASKRNWACLMRTVNALNSEE